MKYKREITTITTFIRLTLQKINKQKLVIGISGGIDSSVSLTLATKAIGKESIYPLLLPYGEQDILDSLEICRFNQIPAEQIQIINIKQLVDELVKTLQMTNINRVRIGNIMARIRMIMLFDQAKKLDALVCGTENKSEKYLGYYTRFGDEASDLEPLQHLYKTQVWELAKLLRIPQQLIDKAPTAGLWEGQTDEKELGFCYKEADLVMAQMIDQNIKPEEIKIKGIKKEKVNMIIDQVKSNLFKQEVPYHLQCNHLG